MRMIQILEVPELFELSIIPIIIMKVKQRAIMKRKRKRIITWVDRVMRTTRTM